MYASIQHFLNFPQCFQPIPKHMPAYDLHLSCRLQLLSVWTSEKKSFGKDLMSYRNGPLLTFFFPQSFQNQSKKLVITSGCENASLNRIACHQPSKALDSIINETGR